MLHTPEEKNNVGPQLRTTAWATVCDGAATATKAGPASVEGMLGGKNAWNQNAGIKPFIPIYNLPNMPNNKY